MILHDAVLVPVLMFIPIVGAFSCMGHHGHLDRSVAMHCPIHNKLRSLCSPCTWPLATHDPIITVPSVSSTFDRYWTLQTRTSHKSCAFEDVLTSLSVHHILALVIHRCHDEEIIMVWWYTRACYVLWPEDRAVFLMFGGSSLTVSRRIIAKTDLNGSYLLTIRGR